MQWDPQAVRAALAAPGEKTSRRLLSELCEDFRREKPEEWKQIEAASYSEPDCAAGIGLCAAAALCAAGTLSPRVAGEEAFAVYTMAKSVSVFGVMERLEPVVSAALTAGGFCLLSVLCLANVKTARALGWKKRTGIGNFLLGCTGYLAGTVLPEGVQAVAAAICWGIVPLLALWVASVKN